IVQALAFLGLGISLSLLFLRLFSGRVLPAAAALVLTQAGEVVVAAAGSVGSDYVHLFLVILAVFLTARVAERRTRGAFALLAVVLMLATLQRFLGVAATATAMAAVLLLGRGAWRQRVGDAVVLGLTTVPMLMWLALTSPFYARRGPITFAENFAWFSRSILEWFTGPIERKADLTAETAMLWLTIVGLTAVAMFLAWRQQPESQHADGKGPEASNNRIYVSVLVLYGLFYILALFGSAAISYYNKLGGRFILPVYVPLLALPVIVADGLVRAAGSAHQNNLRRASMISGALAIAVLGAAIMHTTYPMVMESHARGLTGGDNSFNNDRWRQNPALRYWKRNAPSGAFLLFSNEPDGVAFHTGRNVLQAPRRLTGPYGTDVMPVAEFKDELFAAGLPVYLIWIEPSSYDYYYEPKKLEEIAVVDGLFEDDLGSVYRLLPKGES
ncbi:MAG TPA: hypothetical protein VFH29_04580, partial [Anaerolineales bacterium]|nr:hypothetical protein [Anaerolineales bacterium]